MCLLKMFRSCPPTFPLRRVRRFIVNPKAMVAPPDPKAILRDLARVRAVFQLRAIEAVLRGPLHERPKS